MKWMLKQHHLKTVIENEWPIGDFSTRQVSNRRWIPPLGTTCRRRFPAVRDKNATKSKSMKLHESRLKKTRKTPETFGEPS